jgi:hypothetical protein
MPKELTYLTNSPAAARVEYATAYRPVAAQALCPAIPSKVRVAVQALVKRRERIRRRVRRVGASIVRA